MTSGLGRMVAALTVDEDTNEVKSFKDTSYKRVIILGFVDNIPETYEHMSITLKKLNIHMIKDHYSFVADLKLYKIILGLM